ncbi:afadin [Lates japonicus]|uniref:Afadin n=1 Tax=Lates japonicus TaxID=270547 RepID=A0AAD3NIJ2_LATJO|nr:afadin [Lates japonicus]
MDDKGLRGKDGSSSSLPPEKLPYLVELSPGRGNHYAYYAYRHHEDGSDSRDKPKLYRLQHSITEVGSDCTEDGAIQLLGPGILPHHCNLMCSGMVVALRPATPSSGGQRHRAAVLWLHPLQVRLPLRPVTWTDVRPGKRTVAMMRSRL